MTPQLAQAYMLMLRDPHGDGPHLTGCYCIGGVGVDRDGILHMRQQLVPAAALHYGALRMWRRNGATSGHRGKRR